jgi:hypothetical protein
LLVPLPTSAILLTKVDRALCGNAIYMPPEEVQAKDYDPTQAMNSSRTLLDGGLLSVLLVATAQPVDPQIEASSFAV